MILILDNYDSFTYNLYQQIGKYESDVEVARNDALSLEQLENLQPSAIVLSPGPGRPEDAGICMQAVKKFSGIIPILGICLGHQAIAAAFGGEIVGAQRIMHGKRSIISHSGTGIFAGMPESIEVMRYHSLAMARESLPESLCITAQAADGEIMAVQHKQHLTYGLQFHPESIGTENGEIYIQNFLRQANMYHGEKKGEIRI